MYYIDGRAVQRPVINPGRWAMIGFSFDNALDFSSFTGALRITNPIFVDNLSYYQTTEEDEAERFAFRKWFAVRSEPDNPLDWDYWNESTWREVLFLTEFEPKILDPKAIYRKYVGTDRVILDSDSVLTFDNYRYKAYTDVRWIRQTLNSA
jgi:hypothetical protein